MILCFIRILLPFSSAMFILFISWEFHQVHKNYHKNYTKLREAHSENESFFESFILVLQLISRSICWKFNPTFHGTKFSALHFFWHESSFELTIPEINMKSFFEMVPCSSKTVLLQDFCSFSQPIPLLNCLFFLHLSHITVLKIIIYVQYINGKN